MTEHWKERATRCAVVGCDRPRIKGWSTCSLRAHVGLGRKLRGAGRIEPIHLGRTGLDGRQGAQAQRPQPGSIPGRSTVQPLELPGAPGACRNCGGVDGCYPGCTDHD